MKVYKAYRYELKPNNKQRGLLLKCAGVARFTWNWAIAQRNELHRDHKVVSAIDQHHDIIRLKKSEFSWMKEVSKWIPQESLRKLDRAWINYNTGHSKGIPMFKRKGKHDSFRVGAPISVKPDGVKLPKLGFIRTKENTGKFKGRILAATVNRDVDRWFVSIHVVFDKDDPLPIQGDVVGIDLGIKDFAVIHNGEVVEKFQAPRPMKNNLKKIQRASKKFSKKRVGSNNFKKEKVKLGKLYRKMRYQRKDFSNKLTSSLAKTKSVIIIEDLPTKGLMGNKKLARSIADMGWGNFKQTLEYKARWYGSKVVVINRYEPSSKTCSECGSINADLVLNNRVWICQDCGVTHDRDENAAKNIRRIGLSNTVGSTEFQACGVTVRPILNKASDSEAGSGRRCKTHRTAELLVKSKMLKVL